MHVLVNQMSRILESVVDDDVELGVDYCGDNFDFHCAGDLADAVVVVELDVAVVGVLVDEVVLAGERADERAGERAGVRVGVLADTLVDVSADNHDYHFRLNLIDSIEMIHLHNLMVVLCADVCFGYQYCYRDPGGVDCSDDHDCHDVDDAHRIVVVHFHD